MRFLIKYCGGCNPEYKREKIEEVLRKKFPKYNFFYGDEKADFVILINGCRKRCLDEENSNVISFDSDMDEKDIVGRVMDVLSRKN